MDDAPSQALAVRPAMPLDHTLRVARILAASRYFRDVTSMEQAAAKILAGQEFDIPPMAALQNIYVIDGKTSFNATLIAALIQRSDEFDYHVRVKTAQRCEIEFFRHGESRGVESFTIEEARTAGLLGKANWQHYPKAMLFSRALSNGAKTYCAKVFLGLPVYTPEELDPDIAVDERGDVIAADYHEVSDAPPPATAEQKQQIQAWFREQKMRGPAQDAWLAAQALPPISQMSDDDARRALARTVVEDPPAPDPPPDPEPTEADVPAA